MQIRSRCSAVTFSVTLRSDVVFQTQLDLTWHRLEHRATYVTQRPCSGVSVEVAIITSHPMVLIELQCFVMENETWVVRRIIIDVLCVAEQHYFSTSRDQLLILLKLFSPLSRCEESWMWWLSCFSLVDVVHVSQSLGSRVGIALI